MLPGCAGKLNSAVRPRSYPMTCGASSASHKNEGLSQNGEKASVSFVRYWLALLAMRPVVEKPSTVGTILTCPPQDRISFAPTTVSWL